MNVSELARKLKISSKELLEILPMVGFDVGRRAIKIDDRQAQRVIEQWSSLRAKYRELTATDHGAEPVVEAKPAQPKSLAIPALIRVKDFAEKLKLPLSKVMAELMKNGVLSSMNEYIDFDTASIIGQELGYEITADTTSAQQTEKTTSEKLAKLLTEEDTTKLRMRAPVVVVMGHVDHGKTKLLDAIRQTNVMAGESGGITQHIGAYQVIVPPKGELSSRAERGISPVAGDDQSSGRPITFIDTPGHEAFTTMRSRGARVADIAILVIAADDSIQPQTKESIKIIKSAELPMIVAINKIDKPDADVNRVKQDLAAMDLIPEEWGGKTICVPISAKTGAGIDELLDMILLVAETEKQDIMANPDRLAVGTIIESHVDRAEGPVATALVQNGTLHRGDIIEVTDTYYGKIRAMKDYLGKDIDAAGPSMPVKILGLKAAPSVGDVLQATAVVDKSHRVTKYQLTQQAVDSGRRYTEETSKAQAAKTVNVVLRADVLGSLEAIIASINKMEHPEVAVEIIAKGLGNISENDVERAASGTAVVYGFRVKPNQAAELLAKDKKVEIKTYDIIYRLFDDVKMRLEALLTPEVIRTDLGRVKVLAIFRKDDKAMVVGGSVTKGKIIPGAKVEVSRDNRIIARGTIGQLQSNKVDVNEVAQGHECGLKFEGKPIIAEGDTLEVYTEETKEKKLI